MFVAGQSRLDVANFFVDVPFHAPTERRVKLREVADLHFSSALKYFSASIAAAQPDPAAVIACL